jgi:hypothetical protein
MADEGSMNVEQWKKPKDSETTRRKAVLFTTNLSHSTRGWISVLHVDRTATNQLSQHLL